MPEWVWILMVILILADKFSKVTVIDLLRGLIHLEFADPDKARAIKAPRRRKQIGE